MSITRRITKISTQAGFVLLPLAVMFSIASGVQAQTREPATISLQQHAGWVQVPGALVRPDCVYEVPKGAQVDESGDVILNGAVVAHYEDCPEAPIRTRPLAHVAPHFVDSPGTGNGWVEAVQEEVSLSSGDNIDKITGTWTVPNAPKDTGGLAYIFNVLAPTTEDLIIQPVLQYGATTAGGLIGGNYWVIASWLVGKNAYHSGGETVNPGDTISGEIYINSISSGKINWEIKAKDTTTGAYSDLGAWSSGYTWNWAFSGVLEAYGITTCGELPNSSDTAFKDTKVYHGYPSFDSVTASWFGAIYSYGGPSCGFSATPGSSNTLYY